MEASTSASAASRIMVISEGEIKRLREDLNELSSSIGNLGKQLEKLSSPLVELSEKEDPSITAKCWMKQVRELCYDTGDNLHDFMRSRAVFHILESRAENASETLEWYGIRPKIPSISRDRVVPAPPLADLIHDHYKDMVDKVERLMGTGKELKVVSIVGPEGVGKSTLAKSIFQSIEQSETVYCRAFLRASPKPDILKLLTSMFIQIQRKQPSGRLNAHQLIESIAAYLQDKRYFIIIDDLWTDDVWDKISRSFPNGSSCSRIITTTQIMDVALACCGHQPTYVFNMVPLTDVQSQNLFFQTVFGYGNVCPADLSEVSDAITRKCGGLPLAIINIASMLPNTLKLEEWTGIRDSLPSTWSTDPSSEWMKEVANLMFSTLRPHLKTSLLYFSMYPVGWIVKKDDLVKQWVVEGFLDGVKGPATEEIAGGYFDELVTRGMIQPVDTDKNDDVLSCTLHHTMHDIIVSKSMEENFVIVVDHYQSSIALPDKVRRLSVQFRGATSARIPDSIMLSKVRSLAFFGLLQCFLPVSMVKYRHLRVLILHIWADEDKDCIDLAGIRELLRLRYLKIACNITVTLPVEIQGQQYLEILEIDATLAAIPWDIGDLSELRILKFAVRELSSDDISVLKELVALTSLSVYVKPHVKTAPTEMIVFDKGGLSNLKFFTFRCRAPCLLIEEGAMPKIEKLSICFNASEARQDGKNRITIKHLPSLQEISVKIRGAVDGEGPALLDAFISNNENNPPLSRQDQEHGTLEEEDDIMEEDAHGYPVIQEEGSEERRSTEEDRDETQDDGSGKDEHNEADTRISMLTGSSSSPPVPVAAVDVGWGLATAGWILSPIFTRLVDKALLHMEPGETKENVSTLVTDIIPRLKLTLEEAESSEDKVFFEKLVRELKSNFYELEEILEEAEYDSLESQLTGPNQHELASIDDAGPSSQGVTIKASGKLPESVKTHMTEILKNIGQALEEARDSTQLDKLPGNTRSVQRSTLQVKDRHKTTSREPRVQVIGRDEHIEEITQLLHYTKHGVARRSVIGIYGIAGSGKTTLAQHVYRSEKKADHFEVFMWIHVSRNFSLGEIFRGMLQQVTDNRIEYSGDKLHKIRAMLRKDLRDKRFLLVLDDIWCDKDSDKYKLYELFSLLLQDDYKRSKILVTSRNKNAVSAIGYDVEHTSIEIQDFGEQDFYNLFMYHAVGVDMIAKKSFQAIGSHIAKRLKGSPLAAALVGGLLRKEMTVDHWISVKDDPHLLKGIMGVLWLCYQHLDEQAKRCFAYCSIFRRGHPFERDELVRLWVAEGFIEATDAGQMEEVGQDYFGELVSSSFMQLGEKDSNGGKEYFLVHDLLHDIAVTVGGNDFFRIEDGWRGEVPLDVRHLFVQTSYRFLMKDLVKLEKLRSLIIVTGENSMGSQEVFEDMLVNKRLRKLRVLVIKAPTLPRWSYSLPESIGDLKHMRYLAFIVRRSHTIYIPDAFTKLYHLQVLDCGGGIRLSSIHFFISSVKDRIKLSNLRHLIGHGELQNIGWLTSLENLPFFHRSKLRQLSRLHKLRGKLQIAGLENVDSMEEARKAKLADKKGLRELVLEWGGQTQVRKEVQANVLEGLCPSEHLEELQINGYKGERYPDWMVGDQGRPWRVQRLVIEKCSPLGAIPRSSPSFFTNLLRLTFQDCIWYTLPDCMKHLQKLTVLIISKCWRMKYPGELPLSLKYLEIHMCGSAFMESCKNPEDPNWDKIQHIERKIIGYPRLQDSSEYPAEDPVFSPDASLHKMDIDDNPAKGAIFSPDASLRKKDRGDNTVEDVTGLDSASTPVGRKL